MVAGLENKIFDERKHHGRIRAHTGASSSVATCFSRGWRYCEPYLEIAVCKASAVYIGRLNLYFFPAYANFQLYTYNRWIPQIERLLLLLLTHLCEFHNQAEANCPNNVRELVSWRNDWKPNTFVSHLTTVAMLYKVTFWGRSSVTIVQHYRAENLTYLSKISILPFRVTTFNIFFYYSRQKSFETAGQETNWLNCLLHDYGNVDFQNFVVCFYRVWICVWLPSHDQLRPKMAGQRWNRYMWEYQRRNPKKLGTFQKDPCEKYERWHRLSERWLPPHDCTS